MSTEPVHGSPSRQETPQGTSPTTQETAPSLLDRIMPRTVTRYTRRIAIASLLSQMLIVVTGGLVRLTGSGLGCSTWPKCTPESLTAQPELGIHSYIEFGNRTLTFLLIVIAVLMLLALWRSDRRDLIPWALTLLLFVPLQAVIGAITVITHLNPWIVSLHFLVSMPLIVFATILCERIFETPAHSTNGLNRVLAEAVGVFTALILVMGTVLTGSGPHAGDHGAARNGLDPAAVTPFHSALIYLIIGALVVLLVRLKGESALASKAVAIALAVVLFQGVIGYIQHFLSLPWAVVALHMAGSTMVVAAVTHMLYVVRRTGVAAARP